MKKILSIDGGGIRGIIPAIILKYIEEKTGKPICSCFDLIGGTSTGGILSLGLAKDNGYGFPEFSAEDLLNLYLTYGHKIYSKPLSAEIKSAYGLLDELYSHENLEQVLKQYFGEAILGESLTNVVVSSYDIQNRTTCFLKSWKPKYQNLPIQKVARATSAAPTYFAPALLEYGGVSKALIDGGVFVNNPTASIYIEATKLFPNEDILVISIGTGKPTKNYHFDEASHWGKVQWLSPLFSCMFDGIEQVVDYQIKYFLNSKYHRLQVPILTDKQDDISSENLIFLQNKAYQLIDEQLLVLEYICYLLDK